MLKFGGCFIDLEYIEEAGTSYRARPLLSLNLTHMVLEAQAFPGRGTFSISSELNRISLLRVCGVPSSTLDDHSIILIGQSLVDRRTAKKSRQISTKPRGRHSGLT